MKLRHQHCLFLHPRQTSWWAGKDISLLSLCLMTLMQHMTLFVAWRIGRSDWCRLMINDHFIICMWNRTTLCPPVGAFWLDSCLFLDSTYSTLHANGCLYNKGAMATSWHYVKRYICQHVTYTYILTWLPSRCQKTVGWGLPLVSQGKVAVRPCATIWSRGRTTNWGASEVKGNIPSENSNAFAQTFKLGNTRRTSWKGKMFRLKVQLQTVGTCIRIWFI